MRAEVVAVGSEMLTPTHHRYEFALHHRAAQRAGHRAAGQVGRRRRSRRLKAIVADALRRSDLLILTGGLGPTDDDLTRDVVADVIGRPLEYHADIFEAIEKRFAARGLRAPEINRRQAMVPRGRDGAAKQERHGARPVDRARAQVDLLLPGPPREMKPMLEGVIQERLLGRVGPSRLFRRFCGSRADRVLCRRADAAALREVAGRADEDHDDDSRVARADRTASDRDGGERR